MQTTANGQPAARIEASVTVLACLIEAEGLSRVIRLLQYAAERLSNELSKPTHGPDLATAAKYLKAAEELETPYRKIKDEIRL